MQIDRNSWHFKLNKFYSGNEWKIPTSLCPYFWKTAFFTLFAFIKAVGVASLAWMLGNGLTVWLLGVVGITTGSVVTAISSVFVGLILIAAIGAVCFGIAFGVHWLTEWVKDYLEERKYQKEKERRESGIPPKEPSLMMSFIKAKKSKFCPSIEFVDAEKSE
ncbi:hypothetical protein [Erwinia phage Virsaitis27]|nr:hypothetical protein [Erwinia phage Virsaitis27]